MHICVVLIPRSLFEINNCPMKTIQLRYVLGSGTTPPLAITKLK